MTVGNENTRDFEPIESEKEDQASTPATYQILTYPADYTLEVLVSKWRKKEIIVPAFQRRYVWKLPQASRLIESFLLGLPVPPIFMYLNKKNELLLVDGQQRLKTVAYFFEGYFGEEDRGQRPVFRLNGLNDQSQFAKKTYEDIRDSDPSAFNSLNNAVLRSFVIKQLDPKDDTSIFYIFERLNTGGTLLHGQEIRNAIYYGSFNELLWSLNKHESWRKIVGKITPDDRQRDIELILRFFALAFPINQYEKPMKEYLNKFMASSRSFSPEKLSDYKIVFEETVSTVLECLGEKPFHIKAGLNIAVFDSVFTAFAKHRTRVPLDIAKRYKSLVKDSTFDDYATYRTSDTEVVTKRRQLAGKRLFGE